MYAFTICNEPTLIGYYITKMSFNQLGESNCCLKIVINHYRDNFKKLLRIAIGDSSSRETERERDLCVISSARVALTYKCC